MLEGAISAYQHALAFVFSQWKKFNVFDKDSLFLTSAFLACAPQGPDLPQLCCSTTDILGKND